jgi:hypothetical protein
MAGGSCFACHTISTSVRGLECPSIFSGELTLLHKNRMLYNIYHRIHNWLNKNRVLLFYKQTQFEEEISKAKDDVDRCLEALQVRQLLFDLLS